jgi:hypothetical protein
MGGWDGRGKVGRKDTLGLDFYLVQCDIILDTNRILNETLPF